MMSDDALPRALASEARRQDRELDPRLDRLVWGSLREEEAAALREEARGDPRLALAVELFEPLGADTIAAFVARLAPAARQGVSPPQAMPKSNVAPMRSRALGRVSAVAVPLMLAAGFALWLQAGAPDPLPVYELGSVAGARAVRGERADDEPLALSPSTRVEIVARPVTRVEGPVTLRVLFARGSEVHRWDIDGEISPDGAIRIARAATGPLPVVSGPWDLVVLIGRPDAMPDEDAALVLQPPDARGVVQVLRIATVVLP